MSRGCGRGAETAQSPASPAGSLSQEGVPSPRRLGEGLGRVRGAAPLRTGRGSSRKVKEGRAERTRRCIARLVKIGQYIL